MFQYRPTGARVGTQGYNDIYPGMRISGIDTDTPTQTNQASGGATDKVPGNSPVVTLLLIVGLLFAVRVLYDMAPEGGGRGL